MSALLSSALADLKTVLGQAAPVDRSPNERQILSLLRDKGALAKAEIARLTGLSAQSASVIMRRLEADGLLMRCDPVRGKVGQPSVPMQLAPDGAYFLGLKIGRRSSDLVLVDFLGRVVDQIHITHRYPEPDQAIEFVKTSAAQLIGNVPQEKVNRIAGIGIALPGYLWEWAKIIGEPEERMAAWKDRDLRAEIEDMLGLPTYLQNDASCACGAELAFGNAHKYTDFLYFYIGYFFGGGVVLNGALYTGKSGHAAALAPMRVPLEDGSIGQLIELGSLTALEKALNSAGLDSNQLWERSLDWTFDTDLQDHWVEVASDGLAFGIVSACTVIDFEAVYIDGWLPVNIKAKLVEAVNRKVGQYDLSGLIHPHIEGGSVGYNARAVGAASLPLSQQFLLAQGQ